MTSEHIVQDTLKELKTATAGIHGFFEIPCLMNQTCIFSYITKAPKGWRFGLCQEFAGWQKKNPVVTPVDAQSIVVNKAGTFEIEASRKNPITENATFEEQFQKIFSGPNVICNINFRTYNL